MWGVCRLFSTIYIDNVESILINGAIKVELISNEKVREKYESKFVLLLNIKGYLSRGKKILKILWRSIELREILF